MTARPATQKPPVYKQPWYRRYPKEELAETIQLTCEEYGFLQRLRDYACQHGGIPSDEDFLKRISRVCQLSRYKFKKLWPQIENFFTLRDGFYVYEADEVWRLEVQEINANRKIAGEKGARSRWNNTPGVQTEIPFPDDGKRIDLPLANGWHSEPESEADIERVEGPPPPPTPSAEGGGGPPLTLAKSVTDSDFTVFANHCAQLALPMPARATAIRMLEKFPGLTMLQIIDRLPRFIRQEHAGLWLSMPIEQIDKEVQEQLQRKPNAKVETMQRAVQNLINMR